VMHLLIVLTISQKAEFSKFREIAYATDLRSSDVNIIKWLKQFSEMLEVDLSVIHIPPDNISPEEETSKKITEEILKRTPDNHSNIKYYQGKNIEQSLHEIIKQMDVGMLAMLYRKYDFFKSLFHGSQAHKMIRHTDITVLIFPDSE